jgi:hypothetical protein
LSALCLLVAGVLRASVATAGFTLAWQHSVEKTRWEEDYRIEAGALVLVQSRVAGFGAGMEPGAGAVLVDGMWRWHPEVAPLRELELTTSPFVSDYRLCWNGECKTLRELAHSHGIEVVTLAPCPA